MHSHDDDTALDFAMFDLPTRPGPCRKATAEEQDPVAARLARERAAAAFRPEPCIEVRWGSGKVKV